MSAYNIPGFELDQEVDDNGRAGTVFTTTSHVLGDLTQETRHLSPIAQTTLYAACAVLFLTVPVLLLVGLLGLPLPIARELAVGGGTVLILGLMAIVYTLARKCEKIRAGETFGARVDQRPRL